MYDLSYLLTSNYLIMKDKIEKKISRKEAIKKTGLMAASAATMMVFLKTKKAQATSARAFSKSGSSGPSPQSSGKNKGPWKTSGHKNQNGNGHRNHNGNGHGHH